MKHLWEVKHSYYCTEGNFFGNGRGAYQDVQNYASFEAFLEDWRSTDFDLNLLFRWDWKRFDPEDYDENDMPDDRRDTLCFYFMLQRKGFHISCLIRVTEHDEPRVREYLNPRLAHLMAIWLPLTEQREIHIGTHPEVES